jgi:hypothetical protein
MSIQPRNLFHRPRTVTVALAATLVMAVLGLSRCKMVDQTVTGVDARETTRLDDKESACEHQCSRDYKECKRDERRRHHDAEERCEDLKDRSERKQCEKAEDALHDQKKDECKIAKKQCKRECRYHEGSGIGGR